jgi:guanylate kinase
MLSYSHLTDTELRQQLIEQYMRQVGVYPMPESIQAMKRELYQRGYETQDVIKLALESLLRLQRQAN